MLYLRKSQELAIRHVAARLLAGGNRNYSKDYDSSDDEKNPKKPSIKTENIEKSLSSPPTTSGLNEESASEKLNRLLASMQTTDDHMSFAKSMGIVAKPGEANKKKKLLEKQEAKSKDIFEAAKNVASLLGDGNQQQETESELLVRLLGGKPTSIDATSGKPKIPNKEDISLSDLIVGMKIDRNQQRKDTIETHSEYVRRSMANKVKQQQNWQQTSEISRRPPQRKGEEFYTGSVNLTGGDPLGIFTDPSTLKESFELLPTWTHLHEQSLKILISQPPSNYFDKIARWTAQGKVWCFPIDNEQDWLDEKDVDFTEHIFLEQHLEDWCPNRGPIRHFMELVCVGLSKNPYITAKEKKDHIMWYKNYFESKKDILGELMSKNPKIDKNITDQKHKQVEA